ncbi:chemotaxis protein [Nocardioides baekrokdamisoli]|uniref:Chemotaxis protein n=1 Tax=Nocardioides baekrokdamisoli TaxID=1804624 RepID=A0A3G9IDT1_9ACTN|nr:DUF4012 domain-containing protein [Nocardioides baekrokdamisoli]BBH17117.1 chemotaxis protein [Nocardioides baekrokdamisoli]
MKNLTRRQSILAAIGLLVLLVIVWLVWTLIHVASLLSKAADDGQHIKALIAEGKFDQLQGPLEQFRADAKKASDAAHGVTWGVLTHAPFIGADAKGVRTAADVAHRIGDGPVQDLATVAKNLHALTPHNGTLDLAAIRALQPTVVSAEKSMSTACAEIDATNANGFIEPLRSKYLKLQQEIDAACTGLTSADLALKVMPQMLGESGPQNYLLVMQNNAELRASGGLPGALALVTADHGKLTFGKQVLASSLGVRATPVLPLTPLETQLFSTQPGVDMRDANLTPDFSRAADLWRARWQEVEGGNLDGVIAVDPVTLSYIIGATGPVTLPSVTLPIGGRLVTFPQRTLTQANVVDYLEHQVYIDYPDVAQQEVVFAATTDAVFARLTRGGVSAQSLLKALGRAGSEHRLYVESFDQPARGVLQGTPVAGDLQTDIKGRPRVNVLFNDFTGAKMSYYLRYSLDITTTSCNAGRQGMSAHLKIWSTAPADAAKTLPLFITGGGLYGVKPGSQSVQYMIVGPLGGTISNMLVDGAPLTKDPGNTTALPDFSQTGRLGNRPLLSNYLGLGPGQTIDITWTMTSGDGQTGSPVVGMTPSIVPGNAAANVAPAC